MGTEIERKFLVRDEAWRADAVSTQRIRQGYLTADPDRSVRIRLSGEQAWLTIKGRGRGAGAARPEYEYAIPAAEATELLDRLCLRPQIDKTRHRVPHAGRVFEVDVFHGENEGLVLCEIELESEEATVIRPPWLGREVTGDARYFNAQLAVHPFRSWPERGPGWCPA